MRYFFAFLATLGLIIIVVILLISGGGGGTKKSSTATNKRTLPEYANTDAEASVQIDGRINADSLHSQINISVNRNQVTYQQISGYQGNVVASSSFANNESAYSAFLSALNVAGFTRGNKDKTSSAGQCPLGRRYTVQFVNEGKTLENYWFTSCGKQGNFLGNTGMTLQLFELQVPGYQDLTNNVQL